MARLTSDNSQVSDAVSQSNVAVIGSAPAENLGALYQSDAHSTALLFENAVAVQPQQNAQAVASATQGVLQIYGVNTMAGAAATEKIGQAGIADSLTSLLAILKSL